MKSNLINLVNMTLEQAATIVEQTKLQRGNNFEVSPDAPRLAAAIRYLKLEEKNAD